MKISASAKATGCSAATAPPFNVIPPNNYGPGRMSLHQGGIVDTPSGEWWGFSMMDYNSVGRLTCLSPDHLAGRLALLRSAGKPQAHAADLGETQHRRQVTALSAV